jgi:hypothetical protein
MHPPPTHTKTCLQWQQQLQGSHIRHDSRSASVLLEGSAVALPSGLPNSPIGHSSSMHMFLPHLCKMVQTQHVWG